VHSYGACSMFITLLHALGCQSASSTNYQHVNLPPPNTSAALLLE
jgi:hypothetical protein